MKTWTRTAASAASVRVVIAFVLAAALAVLTGAGPVRADERGDAAAKQRDAEEEISQLRAELTEIDADLAEVFIELETVRKGLEVAEAELVEARTALAAAEQELELITAELETAEATAAQLTAQIDQSSAEEEALNEAVGSLARNLYRGGTPSALNLVMTGEGTGDIAERSAAATTMARAQTRALEDVRSSMVAVRNQSERQEATVERVDQLRAEAAAKQAEAEALEAEIADHVDGLKTLQGELSEKQARWDKRKVEAEDQLAQAEQSRADAAAVVARIDEENRKKQVEFQQSAPAASSGAPTSSGGMFAFPLPGYPQVTSSFGWRIHPIFGTQRLHDGTDFGASCGTPQYAIAPGVVTATYFDSGGGNMVFINHGMINGSSWTSRHLHLQSWAVSVGQQVGQGSLIGYTGTTGNSTGCHLHLTITRNGELVDPMNYF